MRNFVPETFDGASSPFRTSCELKYENGYREIYIEKYIRELIENCVWINEAMNAGHTIVDIGPDPRTNRLGPFYHMELTEILSRNGYLRHLPSTEAGRLFPSDCVSQ